MVTNKNGIIGGPLSRFVIAGAIIFGLLAWSSGTLLMREDEPDKDEGHEEDPDKGTQLDQTA